MKKILLFIFVSLLTITNVKAFKIVSLGDSIPNGYLLDDPDDSYDNRLADTLKADYYEFSYIGMRSDDLLRELEREEIKDNIKDADIVLVNIGANDLLDLFDLIDTSKFNLNIEYGENTQINFDNNMLNDIYQYLKNFFENDLRTKSQEVLVDFKKVFPAIIAKIKEYNPNVKIYVNSLYNPFFDINIPLLSYDLDFISDTSEEAIESFNDFILSGKGYTVIDVYSTLRNNNYLNINILKGLFDPHPNIYGHKKIYELYLKELCYKVSYEDEDYYVLKGGSINIKPKEKKGYKFVKWNYDIKHINQNITLKEVYKKKINYYSYFILISLILVIGFAIVKRKKNS